MRESNLIMTLVRDNLSSFVLERICTIVMREPSLDVFLPNLISASALEFYSLNSRVTGV